MELHDRGRCLWWATVWAATLTLCGSGGCFAAHFESADITLDTAPDPAYVAGAVTLSGWVMPDPEKRTVNVRLDGPGGRKTVQELECEKDGRFTWSWGPLDEPGTWRAYLQGPAKPEVAEVTFEVSPAAAVAADVTVPVSAAVEAATEALGELATNLAEYPEVPGKAEALEKSDQARAKLAELAVDVEALNKACADLSATVAEFPFPMPKTATAMARMAEALQAQKADLEAETQRVKAKVEEARGAHMWCRTWYGLAESLKGTLSLVRKVVAMSEGVVVWLGGQVKDAIKSDFEENVHTVVGGVAFGDLPPATREKANTTYKVAVETCKLAEETYENLKKKSYDSYIDAVVGWVLDWVAKDLTKHCRIYAGPIKGSLRVTYYAKSKPYMNVSYNLNGKAELFFKPREGSAAPVKLQGVIRGDADGFVGSADIAHLVDPIPGATGIGFCIPRLDKRPFFMTVEGEAAAKKMTLRIKDVLTDFDPAKYKFVFLIISMYQPVPLPDFVDLPVPGAQWFFTRATGTAGDKKDFELPIAADGDKSKAKKRFERDMDYRKTDDFTAELALEFDLSSPPW